ncbi:uncharacterized protein M421DRAFT_413355 [Didymella exigua CBS 183.55]|uniref:Secreted protein n=1 Tax=Didymella exigua CBS 183.55 TaxID=1150837 RepID=A0A6A5R3Q1_9PLEO|nr:uncharacterized protein M421DRAFT_413355 [Didymella exigua CBS 183.55]KAF1922282.1 hypothetical protein M421DRAFT_413355 [Didymella exigua CBS 183.55]
MWWRVCLNCFAALELSSAITDLKSWLIDRQLLLAIARGVLSSLLPCCSNCLSITLRFCGKMPVLTKELSISSGQKVDSHAL